MNEGQLFGGRYEIRGLLGSGGMARVHLAYDTRLARTVALKTLLPELARDPEARRRFAREARAAAGLNHPGIVTVHDQDETKAGGTDGDEVVPYLVMEHIEGRTLSELAREQAPLEIDRAIRITCDILDALAHAHAHGLVHRDVKPSNVLIATGGSVKVADFGIARVVHSLSRITGTGTSLGTPGYMSPEQVAGHEVDARSDLYSVGCMLNELLTGTVPFPGLTPLSVMYAHVHQTPPPPSARNPRVPPALDAVVLSALSKNPALRPQSALAMRDALMRSQRRPEPQPQPRPLPPPPSTPPTPLPAMAPPLHPAYNPPHQTWVLAPPVPSPRRRRRWPVVTAVTAAVATTAVIAALLLHPFDSKDDKAGKDGKGGSGTTTTALDLVNQRRTASGYNGALNAAVNPSTTKGGTLKLISQYAPDSLDPVRSYSPLTWNLSRLLMRKLVDYAPEPGKAGAKLVPDLATTTGTVTDGGRTYTYTLKEGLRFEDGAAITAQDVKYGIERGFATDLYNTGPTHLRDLLDQGQDYPGPYKDTDPDKLGLDSVDTPDDRTVVFHLDTPFADFPYVLALAAASPVPKSRDTKDSYQKRPVASGPYEIASYVQDKSLRLVRNEDWDPATDQIRTALPDEVDLTVVGTQAEVDQALLSGSADLDPAQSGVEATTRTKILGDTALKADADLARTGSVRYFSLQTAVAPLDDYRCRWAVQYATDRTALRDAAGGTVAGDVAAGMLPPTVGGYDEHLDTYGTVSGQSQPTQAARFLTECGKPDGFKTVIVSPEGDTDGKAAAEELSRQLALVGIEATVEHPASADFWPVLTDQAKIKEKGWGIVLSRWLADWPTPAGFLRPLLLPDSPYNYAGLDDREINGLMDEADAKTDRNAADNLWRTVDSTAQDRGTLLPFMYERRLNYRSDRLTNVYLHPALGGVDLQALGVA